MAADPDVLRQLIDQLTQERQAYIENANRTNELLQQILTSSQTKHASSPIVLERSTAPVIVPFSPVAQKSMTTALGTMLSKASQRTTTADIEVESIPKDKPLSAFTGDSDSDCDDNESIFVQTPLQPEKFDMRDFRTHVREHPWTTDGKAIICNLDADVKALSRDCLLPLTSKEAEADRSHLSHYSIYDVGFDGTPLEIKLSDDNRNTRAMQIWNRISNTNTDPARRPAAGRIVIVREPSPKLFAALHYTMNKHFDMDEIFGLLNDDDPGLMFPHRAFEKDVRHRRTFVVTFEYFTIIGDMCRPMKWQRSDEEDVQHWESHVPITRCSSVVALSLEGPPMTKVKNRDRRITNKYGDVYDPFSPWRVLSIQAYPDWHATTDTHKASNHYVNGPEAFLYTMEAEFNDARRRLKEVYNRVSDLVEPPPNFIFNSKVRDVLLFEDEKFTYSRKYFWAYQTLSILNQDITEMIESYRETFKDSVWEGSNKIIWPGQSSVSSRYQQFRKRMSKLRQQIDDEVERLEHIKLMNTKKMQDIEALRDNLFSGTSVMESRRSVEQTLVTIEQNRSIMLLTLVTIFFLPLTFVTSVFGMTNMNPTESFTHFAWTVIAVCIPTYIIIGTLHTDAGLKFWKNNKRAVFDRLGSGSASFLHLFGYVPEWARGYDFSDSKRETDDLRKVTSSVTRAAIGMRPIDNDSSTMSRINSREASQDPETNLTSGDGRTSTTIRAVNRNGSSRREKSSSITFSADEHHRGRKRQTKENTIDSESPRASKLEFNNGEELGEQRAASGGILNILRHLWQRKAVESADSDASAAVRAV